MNQVVVFHVDADERWSTFKRRGGPHSEALSKLKRGLRAALQGREGLAEWLVLIQPCGAMEAWLYQHHERVKSALNEVCSCGRCGELVARWEADRALHDEVKKPKDCTCLRSAMNKRFIAPRYPLEEVLNADTSLRMAARELSSEVLGMVAVDQGLVAGG